VRARGWLAAPAELMADPGALASSRPDTAGAVATTTARAVPPAASGVTTQARHERNEPVRMGRSTR
jgi:hypothetical protein